MTVGGALLQRGRGADEQGRGKAASGGAASLRESGRMGVLRGPVRAVHY
jgi:hypothetical protein